ncbi:MAG: SET domain-containing protein-lysine N-methyltransferase [Verrucomicrobia bacterium]|nr:SET domain-containing protein-lysine N-methyltransferase [Verrucomicrobiota bacterium]
MRLHFNSTSLNSVAEFEKAFAIRYLPELVFSQEQDQRSVEHLCAIAKRRGWVGPEHYWLASLYAQELEKGSHLELAIRWIDEKMGYGVFACHPIPAGCFIGEYTGVVRRRKLFGRWKNSYCFDYRIGERRSRYVIDAQDAGNHTRFINHSASPNVETASLIWKGAIHIILFALRPISPGDQLCYDYGPDYWRKRGTPQLIQPED